MPAKKVHIPQYCLHKPSGRAYVKIRGKARYLGSYGSDESREKYGKIIAEYSAQPVAVATPNETVDDITVIEIVAAFVEYSESYYGRGRSDGHLCCIRSAMRVLKELYGHTPARSFGPLALRAIQGVLTDRGAARTYINKQIDLIRHCFKWAASYEMVSSTIHQNLMTVPGLRKGRTDARENPPVLPVPDELVDATLPHLPDVVADMVRVHRLIGCRPGEMCDMRPGDIDRSGDVWLYSPENHKTEHHGHKRVICIGPKAQKILRRYLDRDSESHCFSPAESEAQRYAEQRANRKTKVPPSQRNRRKAKRERPPCECYTSRSYARAITRAVDKANKDRDKQSKEMGVELEPLPKWSPNRLRHSKATKVRREFGLEAAQVVLGHSSADVTQMYAERDTRLAIEVSRKIG